MAVMFGNEQFWKGVASELELGLLSGWEEDSLFDCGIGGCSEEAVDVNDYFLWEEELEDDFVLYSIVDAEEVADSDSEAYELEEDPWWDSGYEDCNLSDKVFEVDEEDEDEVFLSYNLFENEIPDLPSLPLWEEVESEEFEVFERYTGDSIIYQLAWDLEESSKECTSGARNAICSKAKLTATSAKIWIWRGPTYGCLSERLMGAQSLGCVWASWSSAGGVVGFSTWIYWGEGCVLGLTGIQMWDGGIRVWQVAWNS